MTERIYLCNCMEDPALDWQGYCPDCDDRFATHLIGCQHPWHRWVGCPDAGK